MKIYKDCIEDILNFQVGEWYLKLWLTDDPKTEEFYWNVDATVDGYYSLGFEDLSLENVLHKAITHCQTNRWYDRS